MATRAMAAPSLSASGASLEAPASPLLPRSAVSSPEAAAVTVQGTARKPSLRPLVAVLVTVCACDLVGSLWLALLATPAPLDCALGWDLGPRCGLPFLVGSLLRVVLLLYLTVVAAGSLRAHGRDGGSVAAGLPEPLGACWRCGAKAFPYVALLAPAAVCVVRLVTGQPEGRPAGEADAEARRFWTLAIGAALCTIVGSMFLRRLRRSVEQFSASSATATSAPAAVEMLPRSTASFGGAASPGTASGVSSSPTRPRESASPGNSVTEARAESASSDKKITVGKLFRLILPDWPLIINAFIFLAAAAIFQTLIPHYLSQTLQEIIVAQQRKDLSPATFQRPIARLLFAGVACAACSSIRGATFLLIGARANVRLRRQLFEALLKQDIGFFDTTKTGELTSRLTQDCQKVSDQVELNVNVFARTAIQIVTTLCFMFYLSMELTVVSFVAVPIIVAISKEYGAIMKRISETRQKKLADANAVAEETISSMTTVRYFAAEGFESGRFAEKLAEFFVIQRNYAMFYLGYLTSVMTLPQAVTSIVLLHGGRLCMHGVPGSTLLAFVLYLQTLNDNFNSLADFYSNIVQALGAATRVFELMDRQPRGRIDVPVHLKGLANAADGLGVIFRRRRRELDLPLSTVSIGEAEAPGRPAVEGRLEISDVRFTYPARPQQQILNGLSLCCPSGKVMALVGPSGGGKSTVVSLFERLYEVSEGSVLLDGRDVRDFDHRWFHEQVSIVGQEPTLFGRSIRDNILYGLPSEHPACQRADSNTERWEFEPGALVEQAARQANAHDFVIGMAHGYETEVGERGVQLSGGQKQRIAIARALVRNPRVLLLDEATSALDTDSERLVQQAIDNMISSRDMTVVIVAHRLSTVKNADKICVIRSGVVCEEGTHEDLIAKPDGQYRHLVAHQLAAGATDGMSPKESPKK
eukprot:TRINITY_DN2248_c0_g7_i1.p1 TRINITY_DN2248_c0_g7~~TRINITY_DN2248_c0_g7_i1.p1  ORF type:complete len:927 (-),score=187.63 TRINITY_DN2248_c0_g7_i1:144-2924(-)